MKASKWIILLVLLLLPVVASAQAHTVENELLILTIDDETLDMTLTDKALGHTLYSGVDASNANVNDSWKGFLESSLTIDITTGTAVTTERVDIHTAKTAITLTPTENGADVLVDFLEKGHRIRLLIGLDEDSFYVTVPEDGIEEYGETSLCGIYLLPCFGATHLDEKAGYMFIPEGAGAIINFSDGKGIGTTPFSKRIYGDNIGVDKRVNTTLSIPAQDVLLPLYGMVYADEGIGYLAVVEQGAEAAEIMAYPGGVITAYNWTAAHFTLREVYNMPTTRTLALRARESTPDLRDMTIRFYMLHDTEASYVGMAKRYRKVLEGQNALKDGDTTYRMRLDFLGAESEKFLLWDSLVSMTTVDEMTDIVNTYVAQGLQPPLVIYRGWQSGGLSRNLGSGNISLDKKLGSVSKLEELSQLVKDMGGRFILSTDFVLANPERTYNMRLDIVRTIGQAVAELPTSMSRYNFFYYLAPTRTKEIMTDYLNTYQGKFDGIAIATLPNTLYSYYSSGSYYSRADTKAMYQDILALADGMTVALEKPFDMYLAYTDVYLDMPLSTTNYSFISAEVPFLPIVLSGYIPYYAPYNNYNSNQRRQMLKLVEYGAYPSYQITGQDVQKLLNTNAESIFAAKYDVMQEAVLSCDAEISEYYSTLDSGRIIDHQVVDEHIVKVSYDNGLMVIVNYGKSNRTIDGYDIPPMDYLVVKGGSAQ